MYLRQSGLSWRKNEINLRSEKLSEGNMEILCEINYVFEVLLCEILF